MAVLGLILMLAAAALTADTFYENTAKISGTAFNHTIDTLSLGGVFLAGAVTALVAALGLAMVLGGLGRARRRRIRQQEVVAAERDKATAGLQTERDRLAAELDHERTARAVAENTVQLPDAVGAGTPPSVDSSRLTTKY